MLLWYAAEVMAAEPTVRFKHLGIEEGLSSNRVLAIVQVVQWQILRHLAPQRLAWPRKTVISETRSPDPVL